MKRRSGFTLVEMLVAVGIVVIMMSLFTTIFTMATGSMAKQKANAENDQRVRLAQTLLRSDLNRRTFQLVRPFIRGDLLEDLDQRQGYLYIAENDPGSQIDDILQLTVKGSPENPFNGKCIVIDGDFTSAPNQPEYDDALITNDNASVSTIAEVAYFLRNGTLHRRVLLVREPLVAPLDPTDGQPLNGPTGAGPALLLGQWEASGATRNFYSDFDFSACLNGGTINFHGPNRLSNDTSAPSVFVLGKPAWRFGSYVTATNVGYPREHADQWIDSAGVTQNNRKFFGRFTHEETSFVDSANAAIAFGYPGRVTTDAPNPYADPALATPGTSLTLDTRDGRITRYRGGPRISEDVLLTNVIGFDIKVYDDAASRGPDAQPGLGYDSTGTQFDDDASGTPNDNSELGWPDTDDGEFVDLGHDGTTGFYRDQAMTAQHRTTGGYCFNPDTAPTAKPYYRFDTWHPDIDMNGDSLADFPPFWPPNYTISPNPPVRRALKAIQIKVTFIDPQSQQTREFTLVQSLKPKN